MCERKREREREREREKNTLLLHQFLQLQNCLWMEQVYLIRPSPFERTTLEATYKQTLKNFVKKHGTYNEISEATETNNALYML